MKVLGITGGVATGKSAVLQMLAEKGAPTISADSLAHALLAPGTDTTRAVLAAFPGCATPTVDAIDRRALGCLIFADPHARARLEALTHPAIIAALQLQISRWRDAGPGVAAAEIPLLFEAKLERLADQIIVVACTEAVQIARIKARLNGNEAEARGQIAAQWPLSEKIVRADYVIITDGDIEDTRRQVGELWNSL